MLRLFQLFFYNCRKYLNQLSTHLHLHTHYMFSCIALPMTSIVYQLLRKLAVVCTMWRQLSIYNVLFVFISVITSQCQCNQPTDSTNNIILLLTLQNTQYKDIPITKYFQNSFRETVEKEHSCRKFKPLHDLIRSEARSYQCSVLSREQPFICKKLLIMGHVLFQTGSLSLV